MCKIPFAVESYCKGKTSSCVTLLILLTLNTSGHQMCRGVGVGREGGEGVQGSFYTQSNSVTPARCLTI